MGRRDRATLERAVHNWRSIGLDCWLQFSYEGTKKRGKPSRHSGGLSTLEDLEEALKIVGLINKWGQPIRPI